MSEHEHNGSVCHVATHLDKTESCGGTAHNDAQIPAILRLCSSLPDGSDVNFQHLPERLLYHERRPQYS